MLIVYPSFSSWSPKSLVQGRSRVMASGCGGRGSDASLPREFVSSCRINGKGSSGAPSPVQSSSPAVVYPFPLSPCKARGRVCVGQLGSPGPILFIPSSSLSPASVVLSLYVNLSGLDIWAPHSLVYLDPASELLTEVGPYPYCGFYPIGLEGVIRL